MVLQETAVHAEPRIRPLFSSNEIHEFVDGLAWKVVKAFEGHPELYLVTVLSGAGPFSRDLQQAIAHRHPVPRYDARIRVPSYEGCESTGTHRIIGGFPYDPAGRDLLVVEDIVDSGRCMDFLVNELVRKFGARSVQVAALLNKPSRRVVDVPIHFIGFEIPDEFVVGYGMDFNGQFRELPYIGILENPDEL
ncbi:hypoxanthine phosphoribosyltransferase [Candidatus Woesearchaeota archaeon]|nr:hypoxanthine phosphoribosyltransferase [Candidatus Woesearchaeota archaeon]